MHPFVAVMRRYSVDYTARGDLSVCDEIMVDDYRLHMGVHHLTGRDGAYKSAVRAQLEQFPTLGFTVHEIITNGDRLALRFSEHGASVRHGGRRAVWPGISTYRWDGARLTGCWVEQDYYARTRQLDTGQPDEVEPPAVDPWATEPVAADPAVEDLARAWLAEGDLADAPSARLDDGGPGVVLADASVEIDDVFSAGPRAAFHVTRRGRYAGGLPDLASAVGADVVLAASGVLESSGGSVIEVRAITDRLGAARQLREGAPMTAVLRAVALGVDSLDRAEALFAGLLGGEPIVDPTATERTVRFPPGVDLELWAVPQKGLRQLAFAVPDPDKAAHELVDLGCVDANGDGVLVAPAGYGGSIVLEALAAQPVGGEGSASDEPHAPARPKAEWRNRHGPVVRRFDHVCAPAADLERAIAMFAGALGGDVVFGGDNDFMGTRSAQVKFAPGVKVELLHARRPGVPVGEFAARFPDRYHHMTMLTDDLPGLIDRLEGSGYPLIDTDLDSRDTWRETFIRPSATFGALIQLVDTPLAYSTAVSQDVVDDILAGRIDSSAYQMRPR